MVEKVREALKRDLDMQPIALNELALPNRLQSFRRNGSCSISLSRVRSATTLRSLAFSFSNCCRRISFGSRPSYFFFQLK